MRLAARHLRRRHSRKVSGNATIRDRADAVQISSRHAAGRSLQACRQAVHSSLVRIARGQ